MRADHPADGAGPLAGSPGDGAASPPGRRGGLGPFITFIEFERPDGLVARIESRRRRKSRGPDRANGGTWWDPRARGWWIGVLFAVGSTLFAVGAAPGYAGTVGDRSDSITFFVGSLFFTAAAFLQYRESVDAGSEAPTRGWGRILVWRPYQIDWWASGIQLVGTVYFNVSTGTAMGVDLTSQQAHQHVWRPDAIGSVCFLVASSLAWFEVCHGWLAWSPRRLAWWITLLNLVGSIAFMGSAVAGYIVPATGQVRNVELSNLGTFIGAVCFLAGAILLLPERTEAPATPPVDWSAWSSTVRTPGNSTDRARTDGR